jgi:magnesium transporter
MDRTDRLALPAIDVARQDMPLLGDNLTVDGALAELRRHDLGDRVVYLYVVDADNTLVGVLPVRRLLHAQPHELIRDLAPQRVVTLHASATVLEACEMLVTHRFLAIPIVDEQRHLLGVVDVSVLTDEVFDLAERQEVDDLFETIGFRVSQIADVSPQRAFRLRFPWLLATIAGGTSAALLAGVFEATLKEAIVLSFFLTLVLGLGEAVAAQSLAITIPTLRHDNPDWRWYLRAMRREAGTSLLLGVACGLLVAGIVFLWRGDGLAAGAIGLAITFSLVGAAFFGMSVPALLHRTHLDPTIAAGPVALALADITTVIVYLGIATLVLAH